MNRFAHRIAITGMGVVSSIGIGRESFWSACLAGKSGLRKLEPSDLGTLPVPVGGPVPEFDPGRFVKPKKAIKLMCRETQMSMAATALALEDGRATDGWIDPERLGIVFGSQMFYGNPETLVDSFRGFDGYDLVRWGQNFPRTMFPLWLLLYLPNMPACHTAIAAPALGPNNTIVQGSASGVLAIIEAITLIERGWADAMLVGGVGERLIVGVEVYKSHESTSPNVDPATACRPYDLRRDGSVPSEGAGALLLESLEHARARQAPIYAEITGFSRCFGRSHERFGGATLEAQARCLDQCLQTAKLTPRQVGHISPDAMGTEPNDAIEAQALHQVLPGVPVITPKATMGDTASGSGVIETAISVMAIQEGILPAFRKEHLPDPRCPVDVVFGGPRPLDPDASAIVIKQSNSGQVAAVALRRCK